MAGRGRSGRGRRSGGQDAVGRDAARPRATNAARPRPGRAEPVPELCERSPLAVFCAYWLGITEDDGFRVQTPRDVAKRFGFDEGELEDYLAEHDLTRAALESARFDLASARLDVERAPEGISRLEVARVWWQTLVEPALD